MPFEFAGIGIERDDGIGIKIVARPLIGVPIGPRVANSPISEVERGIVGARVPNGSAAILPIVAAPGLVARFAGSRNGVETPSFLTGLGVIGRDETAYAELATTHADDDFVLHHERSHGDRITEFDVADLNVPKGMSVRGVDRNKMRIEGAHVER